MFKVNFAGAGNAGALDFVLRGLHEGNHQPEIGVFGAYQLGWILFNSLVFVWFWS